MASYGLIVPFLNQDSVFCQGVEFGMQVMAPMLAGEEEIRGYFLSENEEQIRLACYRMGYAVTELKPWRHKGKYTGWVWMVLEKSAEKVGISCDDCSSLS